MKIPDADKRNLTGLKVVVRKLRLLVRTINKPNSLHNNVHKNLLSYIDLQLTRLLALIPNGSIDLVSLVTRDLIEVALWSEFITKSSDNMRQFREEASVDLSEMFKLVDPAEEGHAERERKVAAMCKIGQRRVNLKKTQADDVFWFKLCSKFIHPTSWSINFLHKSQHAGYYRLELGSYAFRCAIRAVTTLTGVPIPFTFRQ